MRYFYEKNYIFGVTFIILVMTPLRKVVIMKRKNLYLFVAVLLFISSCIFQNDPLKPNRLPVITGYGPADKMQNVIIPGSALDLYIEGVDPEGDDVSYSFAIVNLPGREDSILCRSNSFHFTAEDRPGLYNVEGRVHDSEGYSSRNWFLNVKRRDNNPHEIVDYYPKTLLIQCALGDTLRFGITRVEDDHPDELNYRYMLGDSLLVESKYLTHRFLDNDQYTIRGIVWDGEYGDTLTWEINATGTPDTIAPACIVDLAGRTGEARGTVFVEWTAPGDDGSTPGTRASYYDVRTSTVRIKTEEDWANASQQSGAPPPSSAGERDSMIIDGLEPGEQVYVYIKAVDDFNNKSSICGSSPHLQVRGFDITGRVIDVATGEGVEGALVKIGNITVDTSSAGGYYQNLNNRIQYLTLMALDENGSDIGAYHNYSYDYGVLNNDLEIDLFLVPSFELVSMEDDRYDDFLDFFQNMVVESPFYGTVFKGWDHWPVKVYNPMPTEADTIDFQQECLDGMNEWEDYSGLNFFEIVDSSEEADVEVYYDYSLEYGNHHVEIMELNPDGTPARKRVYIYYRKLASARKSIRHVVFVHEFGHILGLHHSLDSGHIMIGMIRPSVDHASEDEINVVKAIYHLPKIFDYRSITRE
ncbi:MAG: matrixin family metalloprotease [Candidatus Latescibacteria bacterium]|nr:matrixin family metalloprotease [bacterium]MBD3423859.1 matrixin family metalloprotease [Candidatus Latescibacterota bacterium]